MHLSPFLAASRLCLTPKYWALSLLGLLPGPQRWDSSRAGFNWVHTHAYGGSLVRLVS